MATAVNVVQAIGGLASSVGLKAVVFGSSVVAGNTIIVGVCQYRTTASTNSVTDSAGNTYTKDASHYRVGAGSADQTLVEIWRATNVTGGAITVTVTASAGTNHYFNLAAMEVSGLHSSPVDVTNGNGGNGSPITTGSVTTTNAEDLIVAAFVIDSGAVAGASNFIPPFFAPAFSNNTAAVGEPGQLVFFITNSIRTVNATWLTVGAADWQAAIVAYKCVASGGGLIGGGNLSGGLQ